MNKDDIIKFIKKENTKDTSYRLEFYNGVDMGIIYKEVDGYYVYWPSTQGNGFWEGCEMRIIADKLDELNEEYHREVQEYFKKEMKKDEQENEKS